ncbi:MAG: Holliday junction ATP-dependent DNA helicase RuvB [Mycoplasmataceae bacterium]|nr:MAG: Holliday junction ATP-dependent DNA helicase RuvB [Mycoplasmataceae bacterium]
MLVKKRIESLVDLKEISIYLTELLKPNSYLLLQGDLGVGKTTLTQMIAQNFGIKEKVSSPTFNILQQHQIKEGYCLNHFDFFRLTNNDNLEIFHEFAADNLNIIEWPEKNPHFWQDKEYIFLKLFKEVSGNRIATIFFPNHKNKIQI